MKTLYRFFLMILLMLPALNVLAADVDAIMLGNTVQATDCMAMHKSACHEGKASKPADKMAMGEHHGLLCSSQGCTPLCTPSLLGHEALTVSAIQESGSLVPYQPAKLAGIVITPPHRPPLLV
ncbi:hypothetical protein [Aquitalea pelogenes]|uniref:hypothetical protein n=1 Tax=Aquitalea pelogenes TaxID=1293573 RepID=UPI0035B2D5D6